MRLTVRKLIAALEIHDLDAEVFFGNREGLLTFYRVKARGDDLIQIEFDEEIIRLERGGKVSLFARPFF